MTGGFTWRIGWPFEVGSPKQVQFGGRETLTLGPQSQVPTLGLAPYLKRMWAPISPNQVKSLHGITLIRLGAAFGALVRS